MTTRALGFWTSLALVVGNLIGSGIYLLPATLAPYGWNALIGWLITIGGALALAYVFARLSARMPAAGGPFAYTRAAFGPVAGFAVAWSYWVMLWSGNGAIAVAVVSALSLIVPGLSSTPGLPAVLAMGVVWLLIAVNIKGVTLAGQVQLVTTLLKLIPLFGVALLALILLGEKGSAAIVHNPPVPLNVGTMAGAAAITFWGFLGLESATVPAERVIDAERTVPRVTLWGTAATGLVYIVVWLPIAAMMPAEVTAGSPAPIAEFLGRAWGGGIADIVALFAAISAFGTLNGFTLLQGEVPWAMAKDGVFPAWLAKETPQGTPARAHIVSGVLLTVVTLANYTRSIADLFTFVALVSIGAGLIAYLACAAAVFRLVPGEWLVRVAAVVSAAFIGWMLYGLGLEADLWALALLAAGFPVYLWVRRATPRPVRPE